MSRNHPLWIALAILAAIALSLAFVACAADDDAPAPAPTPAPAPAPAPAPEPDDHDHEMAVYRIEYEALISSNPLFQALGAAPYPEGVGVAPHIAFFAHPMGENLWELGGMASAGLKVLAETGASEMLLGEAVAAGYEIYGSEEAQISALLTSDDPIIEVHHDEPCFSFAQMIAPSTDWFIGFSTVCAVDENGEWLEEVAFESYAFDAGTAMGEDFMFKAEEGADTMEAITYLEVAPFGQDSPVSRIIAHEVHE